MDPEDLDQCGFRDFLVFEEIEQVVRVVVGAAGQRPGGPGHDPLVAVGEAFTIHVEVLVIDERAQDIDEYHRVSLV